MHTLINTFDKLNISYDEEMILKFEKYMDGILLWNEKSKSVLNTFNFIIMNNRP